MADEGGGTKHHYTTAARRGLPVAALRRLYNHSRSCSPDPRRVEPDLLAHRCKNCSAAADCDHPLALTPCSARAHWISCTCTTNRINQRTQRCKNSTMATMDTHTWGWRRQGRPATQQMPPRQRGWGAFVSNCKLLKQASAHEQCVRVRPHEPIPMNPSIT